MHATVALRLPGAHDRSIRIDRGIAPLIESLWKLGLRTQWCCQGDADDHRAYITFASKSEARWFCDIAGRNAKPRRLWPETVDFPDADIPRIAALLVRRAWFLTGQALNT
jgi:hypothetical protein